MYTIGLSTCGKIISEELFQDYQRAGIGAMEISSTPENYETMDFHKIRTLADRYGINLWSFHLPFMPFETIDISRDDLAKDTIEYFTRLIKKVSDVGVDKFIVHPSGEPVEEHERAHRLNRSKESLLELAEIAKSCGAVLAVEDLPRSCIGNVADEIAELVSVHPSLGVCLDTNHLLTEDPVDFIYKLGDKIITTHVSDYDMINERHWLPGEGKINWSAMLQALRDVNYKGVWLYEMGFGIPKTILRERRLTCEDIVENAKALFANKKPPIFSTPKPNLGMWE